MIRYVLFSWLFIFAALLAPAFAQAQIFRRGGCFNGHCAPHVVHAAPVVKEIFQAPDNLQTFIFNNIAPPGPLNPTADTVYGVSRALEWNAPNGALIHDNVRRSLDFATSATIEGRQLDSEIVRVATIDSEGRAAGERGRAFAEAFRAFNGDPQQARGVGFEQVTLTLRNGKVEAIQRLDPQQLQQPVGDAPQPRLALGAGVGCAKCHTGDGEGAKKFSLDGPLSLEDFARGEAAINSGAMPPKSNLSKIERSMEVLKLGRLVRDE